MAAAKGNNHGKQFSKNYQPAEKWTEEKALKVANDLLIWLKSEEENIFFGEFLYIENDYYEELIAYLSRKYKSFLKLIKKARSIQKIKLMKYGAFDKLNASITKFVLNVEHGMIEQKQTDITTNGKEIKQTNIVVQNEATKENINKLMNDND